MKYLFIFLIGFLFSSSDNFNDWQLKDSIGGIEVYTRIDSENRQWSRLECEISSPIKDIVSFASQVETLNSWVYACESSKLISQKQNITIYHTVTDMPFPISDRDLIIKKERKYDPSSGIYSSALHSLNDYDYPTDYLRVNNFIANWQFIPLDGRNTKIIYEVYADPGGSIPDWIVDRFATKGPLKSLENLRSRWE